MCGFPGKEGYNSTSGIDLNDLFAFVRMKDKGSSHHSFIDIVLLFFFILLSILGWLRFEQAMLNWQLLIELGAVPGPAYIAAGGVLWGLAGLGPAWGLWSRKPWAVRLSQIAGPVYPVTYWADKLAFNQNPQGFQNWPFALGLTVIWLGLIYLGLPRARSSYPHEQGK